MRLAFGRRMRPPLCSLAACSLVLGIGLAVAASAHEGGHDTRSPQPTAPATDARAGAAPLAFDWRPGGGGRSTLTAIALDPASHRVAVGDARGVTILAPGGAVVATFSRPEVTALAFSPEGALLVGTTQGLFAYGPDGTLTDRSPAPGEETRRVTRLAACAGAVAAATEGGVYVSPDAARWQPVPGRPGREAAIAVALRCQQDTAELRAIAGGEVWRASLTAPAARIGVAEAVAGLDSGLRTGAVDVLLADGGEESVLASGALASRPDGSAPWQTTRPVLAPGAVPVRLLVAAGRRWIATDRGLFGEEPGGSWLRLPAGAVFAAVSDVAGDAARILAATQQGLLEGRVEATPRSAAPSHATLALEFPGRREPAIQEIFAAALEHLSLRPEWVRNLRHGLAVRGLLPTLDLRLERGRILESDLDDDESFVSGDLRRLRDQHRGSQRAVTALVQLSWELGDLAYSEDAVDLSKEARAVIQLRDDVLDEITQLFFERRRVLLELDSLGAGSGGADAARLRLRADELAAGLDAWTGGWFGRRVAALAP